VFGWVMTLLHVNGADPVKEFDDLADPTSEDL
jgi:hypothetical protein